MTNKDLALKNYKERKIAYLKNKTNENWISFCDARVVCMRLGIRV